jgi:hypothetical protein
MPVFTLPVHHSATGNNFTVYWGDGTSTKVVSNSTNQIRKDYATSGFYSLSVVHDSLSGFGGVKYDFNNGFGGADSILNIKKWGNGVRTNDYNSFYGCDALSAIDADDFPIVNASYRGGIFQSANTLKNIPYYNTADATNLGYAFKGTDIVSFPAIDTRYVTNLTETWRDCTFLRSFPLINTSNVVDATNAWNNCLSLTSFPSINTSKISNFTNMWIACKSLSSFPLINTSNGTNFTGTWRDNNALISFPAINTLSATKLNSTWAECYNLTVFPYISTHNVTDFYVAWQNCRSLASFPLLDTSKGNDFSYAWRYNYALASFPQINTLSATSMVETWRDCFSLSSFPSINTSKISNLYATWYNCYSLSSFPFIDTSNVTSIDYTWGNCSMLSSFEFPALNFSKINNGTGAFIGVRLKTNTYSSMLTALCAGNTNTGVNFNGGLSFYRKEILPARTFLTHTKNWNITDEGIEEALSSSLSSFIIKVDVSKTSGTGAGKFLLPISNSSNCSVDWGDGSVERMYRRGFITHTYPSNGIYNIAITQNKNGGFIVPSFWDNGTDALKVIDWIQGGYNSIGGMALNFINCQNMMVSLSDVDSTNNMLSSMGSWMYQTFSSWFGNAAMKSFPALNFKNITSMPETWSNVTGLTSFGLINCEGTSDLFFTWNNCTGLKTFPAIRPINCIDMRSTWKDCTSLVSFPYIETPRVQAIGKAWANCNKLQSFPPLILSAVTTAYSNANNTTSDYFGAWSNCTSLTGFPLVNLSNCTDFRYAWKNCYSLSATDFPTLNMSKMTSGANCFEGVKLTTYSYSALLTSLCASNFNTGVTFHGGNSKYNEQGQIAHTVLTNPIATGGRAWNIIDGGLQSSSFGVTWNFDDLLSYPGTGTTVYNVNTYYSDPTSYGGSTLEGSYSYVKPYLNFTGGSLRMNNFINRYTVYIGDKNQSFSLWFYPTSNGAIIEENGSVGNWITCGVMNLTGGNSIVFGTWNGSRPYGVGANITFNSWNHIVWVYEQGNTLLKGYLNGQLVAITSTNRAPAYLTGDNAKYHLFTNGGNFQWNNAGTNISTPAQGRLYQFEIYSKALNASEVLDRYKSTNVPLYMKNPNYSSASPLGTVAMKALYINYFYAPTAGSYTFAMTNAVKVSPINIDDAAYISIDNGGWVIRELGESTSLTVTLTQGMHKIIVWGKHITSWGSSLAFRPSSGQYYMPNNIKSFIGKTLSEITVPASTTGLITGVQGLVLLLGQPLLYLM